MDSNPAVTPLRTTVDMGGGGGGGNEIQRVRSDTSVTNPLDTPPEQPLMLDRACCTWTRLFTCCPLRLQKYSMVHCFLTEDACSSALKSPLSVKMLFTGSLELWSVFLKCNNWILCKNGRNAGADGGCVSESGCWLEKKVFYFKAVIKWQILIIDRNVPILYLMITN